MNDHLNLNVTSIFQTFFLQIYQKKSENTLIRPATGPPKGLLDVFDISKK